MEQPVIKETGHAHIDNSKCFPHFYKDNACTVCIKKCYFSYREYEDLKKMDFEKL